jgi:SNF family Na+-dependent transporter
VVFELNVGKLFRKGPIKLFLTVGSSRWGGVGIASVVTAFLVSTYYTVLLAWALVFLVHCFHNPLPW